MEFTGMGTTPALNAEGGTTSPSTNPLTATATSAAAVGDLVVVLAGQNGSNGYNSQSIGGITTGTLTQNSKAGSVVTGQSTEIEAGWAIATSVATPSYTAGSAGSNVDLGVGILTITPTPVVPGGIPLSIL
jgi:hypothetical protein